MEQLLALSGGVGRVISDVLHGLRAPRAGANPVELFLKDEPFAMLATHMLSEASNAATLDSSGKWPPPIGMDEATALRLLELLGFGSDAVSLLARWRDDSVLILSPSDELAATGRIEFLFPYHAAELRALISPAVQRNIAHARIQLHGVAGSLGNALEELCRPQLGLLFEGASQRGATLVMRAKVPHVEVAGSAELVMRAKVPHVEVAGSADVVRLVPTTLLGQVIRWPAQTGIEDFVLSLDDDDPSTVWIDGWQCTSPAVGAVLRAGDLPAALAGVIAAKSLSTVEDAVSYLSNASAKACWGICALVAILTQASQLAAPGVAMSFRPRSMYLRTTAVLHDDARAAAMRPVLVDAAMIAAFNSSGRCKSLGCVCPAELAGSAFCWLVEDGVMWTTKLLPSHHNTALTTPTLRTREMAARARATAAGAGVVADGAVGGAGAPK